MDSPKEARPPAPGAVPGAAEAAMATPGSSAMFAPPPPPPPPPQQQQQQQQSQQQQQGAPRATTNLVDDFEAAFEACCASLVSQEYVNSTDQDEIRTGVDQSIHRFLDVARQCESFFLQKRLQLSVQKPEQVIREDITDLKAELQRKESLIQRHLGKLRHWQAVLEDIHGQPRKGPSGEAPTQGPLAFLEQASANLPAAPSKN
ncbi:mediator of RNA polymerase II transcription subunit 28 [Lethenteron reissneri]|uniref:mediator of RNA polymerase II transcription subunit 28 n=1 Tax=Lethenteron reissneri TaxID=7753 RepID=UPI002AB6484B|nr:mediator of RNA polymerase II transcription subunit 28 [Lethenteron reissneri]